MVSQRPGVTLEASSRERLLAAAAVEFAARGFDGAKVDRIARRARVNKAMLYYHFKNKAALYRAILDDLFRSLAARVAEGKQAGGPPDDQVRRFIRTVASEIAARPHFPQIWLREIAEGGRHLDHAIIEDLVAVLSVLAGILQEGRRAHIFGPVHPLVAQIGIVAPLLFFAASAPIRERFGHVAAGDLGAIDREVVIAHVEKMTLAALGAPASARPRSSRRSRPRR